MSATSANQGSPERPQFSFDVEDIEYVRHGDKPLLLRLFRPRGKGPFPLAIYLHGGGWCNQDRTADAIVGETLAANGVAVASLDFRMPPDAGYPAALADINYATRWLKAKARDLNVRADRVGTMGNSSGGHLAMLTAMRPSDPRYAVLPLADAPGIDAKIAYVVLVGPVIDPLGRLQYGRRLQSAGGKYPEQLDRILPLHAKFWGTEEAQSEGSPVRILDRGEAVEMPPVLYLQGAAEVVHPRADLDRFVELYRRRGGKVDLTLYEGEVEGFIRNPDSKSGPAARRRVVDFVHGQVS